METTLSFMPIDSYFNNNNKFMIILNTYVI